MVILRLQHKIDLASQYRDPVTLRQAVVFGSFHVDDQRDFGLVQRRRAKKPHAARLDQTPDRGGATCGQPTSVGDKLGAVVGDKQRAQRDQPQGQ